MSIFELDAKANAYFDIMEQIGELNGHGWRATWHNTTQGRFNSKRSKADHGDMYAAYTIKTTGTRFTLNTI